MNSNSDDFRLFRAVPKDPERQLDVELDIYDICASKWRGNEDFSAGEFTLPLRPTGFSYEVTTAGRTGAREPAWPRTLDATIPDGSVVWTCRAAASNALYAITDLTAESDPPGLTISNVSASENYKVQATYEGGVLDRNYDAVFTGTINERQVVFRNPVMIRKQ